jgi:hypothetical protein
MGTRSVGVLLGARGGLLGRPVHHHSPDAGSDGRPGIPELHGGFPSIADHGLGKVYNLAWSLGMFLGPIVALVLLWDDPGSTSFVLTAIGLGIVVVGVIIISNVWKTPHYKVMLAWNPEAMPADWEAGRRTYFTINWLQLAATWAAFALFLLALISL